MEKKIIKKEEVKVVEPKAVAAYKVYDQKGVLIRTYTQEEGKDFAKKAEQFAEKNGYSIK